MLVTNTNAVAITFVLTMMPSLSMGHLLVGRHGGLVQCAVGPVHRTCPLERNNRPVPVVGYLGSETPEKFGIRVTAFQQGLSAMGFDDGRNVKIEYRWANGQNERLRALAADLVRRQVAVIATPGSNASATAARQQPIRFRLFLRQAWTRLQQGL